MKFKPIIKDNAMLGAKIQVTAVELSIIRDALRIYSRNEKVNKVDSTLAEFLLDKTNFREELNYDSR